MGSHRSREPGTQRNTCSPPGTASGHHSVLPWDKSVGNSEVTPRAKGRDPPRKLRNKLEPYEGQCEGRWMDSVRTPEVWTAGPHRPPVFLMLEKLDPGV